MLRFFFKKKGLSPKIDSLLDKTGEQVLKIEENGKKNLRILYGPSFSIHPPCFIHDRILSYALRIRGSIIIPVFCDQIQTTECNFFGGDWMKGTLKKNCKTCIQSSTDLWHDNPIQPLKLSSFLSKHDIKQVEQIVQEIDPEDSLSFYYDNMPFGLWAKDIFVNNRLIGDYHRAPEYKSRIPELIKNLLIISITYKRILDTIKPDRVISNDSYYGMWAIMQELSMRRSIPFYSQWQGGRKLAWCYAYNDAAMNLNFRVAWPTFSQIDLLNSEHEKIKEWVDSRVSGKDMILDTTKTHGDLALPFDSSKINNYSKKCLLTSNVIWDLAALDKQCIFFDMMDWIIQTIHWFRDHPDYLLIIKPHPGEQNPKIPQTVERVEEVIRERGIKIPDNVILLPARTQATVYDLFSQVDLGIVHTSTVGIEMAAHGIPVITTGKSPYRGFGFTYDPEKPEEYYDCLKLLLEGQGAIKKEVMQDLAYKFIKFYHFHYYMKINLIEHTFGDPVQLHLTGLNDIMPGKNIHLDYVLDSIIAGIPIISEYRWPPISY